MTDNPKCKKFIMKSGGGSTRPRTIIFTECMPREFVLGFKYEMNHLLDDLLTPGSTMDRFDVIVIEHKHGMDALFNAAEGDYLDLDDVRGKVSNFKNTPIHYNEKD